MTGTSGGSTSLTYGIHSSDIVSTGPWAGWEMWGSHEATQLNVAMTLRTGSGEMPRFRSPDAPAPG